MQKPDNYDAALADVFKSIKDIEGHLTDREVRFLFMMASCPTAEGDILEIGSFKGRSTVVLSKAAQLGGGTTTVNAVDPLTSPSVTDPSLGGAESGKEAFSRGLAAFLKCYLLKRGMLDGKEGFIIASYNAIYTYCKYLRLLELQEHVKREP